MAQGPTTPKIEELRFRLKTDPKNRLFYPLAEELRKVGQFTEAEHVLRTGLTHHPTYLSAWVSLGRVLRETGKHADAVESLSKALQLDPGNVVAARLLADAYLALGEKVEAIKKYKLVHALMPQDDTIVETIANLDAQLNPPVPVAAPEPEPVAEPEPEPVPEQEPEPEPEPKGWTPAPMPAPFVMAEEPESPQGGAGVHPAPEAEPEPEPLPIGAPTLDESPFASDDAEILAAAEHTFIAEEEEAVATADEEPMLAAHAESPFEEPAPDASFDAVSLEQPLGMHVEDAPLAAEVPAPLAEEEPAGDVFMPTVETPFPDYEETPVATAQAEDVTDTVTMADLYARQGMNGKAREIYEHILQRDPQNEVVRAKADALDAAVPAATPTPGGGRDPKVARLEEWLAKVTGKEVSRV